MGAQPDLSVVISAYNEEDWLHRHVPSIVAYLRSRNLKFEINDGSQDGTARVAQSLPDVRLIDLQPNRGQGGMHTAQGRYVLFTDADQSTPINEVENLLAKLDAGYDMALGSRAVPGAEVEQPRVWYRMLAGRLFGIGTWLCCIRGIHDTQCGFKAMTHAVAQKIFPQIISNAAIFDIETLVVAAREGYRIAEVPIKWVHDLDTHIPYNFRYAVKIWAERLRIRNVQRVGFPLKVRG